MDIKKRIDEYLGFDSDKLLRPKNVVVDGIARPVEKFRQAVGKPLIRVFGGAVRDTIAGQKINDLDVLVGSKMLHTAEVVLHLNGFVYMENLTGKDLGAMYKELHIIDEPRTWMNPRNMSIVQLIRPAGINSENPVASVVQNVDISCCGVSWDGYDLYENFPNAVMHCQTMHFQVNQKARMRTQRTEARASKLMERGWERLKGEDTIRDLKINALLDAPVIKFVPEYGKEPIQTIDEIYPF